MGQCCSGTDNTCYQWVDKDESVASSQVGSHPTSRKGTMLLSQVQIDVNAVEAAKTI